MHSEILGGVGAAVGPPAEAVPDARSAQVVGLDCEWSPFGRRQTKTAVSILQVATRKHIYIVDLLVLIGDEGTPGAHAFSRFLSSLLAAPHVVKLGFQLAGDLARLCESYPRLPCFSADHRLGADAGSADRTEPGNTAVGSRAPCACFDVLALARAVRPDLVDASQSSLSRLVSE
ncbi:putative exonuclease mut-7, partial [Tetrabaena socialis]